jgi:uncharacterized repeat protein (TIGR01451 family)
VPPGTTRPVDPPTPVVDLRVRVPAGVGAGQEIEYRICVENHSRADAHHVLVRDPIPANAHFVRATPEPTTREPELTWRLGTLAGGACREIRLVLVPTGDGDVNNCARVQFEHGECVTTRVSRPGLAIKKCGPTQAVLYDNLSYQISVTNTGQAEATKVVVTDTLPEGLEHAEGKAVLTWDLGTVAPGQCRQVEYQAIAKKTGRLCNRAAVTAAGGIRVESENCVTVGEARLELQAHGPEHRYLPHPATYQLTVINNGSSPVTNATVTDFLPAGTTFVSASSGGQHTGTQVRWTVGTLPPGARRTVQLVLQAQEPGEVVNRATAAADRGLNAQAEVRTHFDGAAGLTAELEVKDDPVEVGVETTYAITVLNQGVVPATKVQTIATVPEQMQVVSAKGPVAYRQEGTQVIFEAVPTMQPKAEGHYYVTVKAVRPGDVRFKVDLVADQLPAGPVHREESTTIYADVVNPPPPTTRLEAPQAVPAPAAAPETAPPTTAEPPMVQAATEPATIRQTVPPPAPTAPPPTAEPPAAPARDVPAPASQPTNPPAPPPL